jgi:biopolymer transport protein ExbD
MIEAEEGVPHGQVVKLLDAVRGAGFRGVGIGTTLEPVPDAPPR